MNKIIEDTYLIPRCIFPFLTYDDLKTKFKEAKQFYKYFKEAEMHDKSLISNIELWSQVFPKTTVLKCDKNITDEELLKLTNYNLTHLYLEDCMNIIDESLIILSKKLTKLIHLYAVVIFLILFDTSKKYQK